MKLWMLVLLAQSASWQHEILSAHNAARAQVKVPALKWSDKLAAYAQPWANNLLSGRQLKHRKDNPYGENLYVVQGQRATPAEVVKAWLDEPMKGYNHRTQIVWRDTTEIGCAVARNKLREVWVCNYNPPGNVVGQRPY